MPTLTQLEYIIAVDEAKNFSRAAKHRNISQPSLSAQIQKVEDELGFIIFDRTHKPILTTQKGLQLIEYAKNVLREHRKIFDIKNDQNILSGDFRLAVIPSLASYVIPLFIESFSSKFPKVNLYISEFKTEDMIEAIEDDQIDAGLLVTPLYEDKIVERVLFYERFYLFMSQGHELASKKVIAEEDLHSYPIWLLEEGHCFREQVIRVCSLNKRKQVLENVNFASGGLETLINLVRKGRGITLLPELALSSLHEQEQKNLIRPFKKPIPTREVSLVYGRAFLKQEIIEAIEKEIIFNLPKNIKSLKKDQLEIIDI